MPWIVNVATVLTVLVTAGPMLAACGAAHGPLLDRGTAPPVIDGTISGVVRTQGRIPLPARRVTAIDMTTAARYEVFTASTGGYSLKVPAGRYRLDVELLSGELLIERPADLSLGRSDLDAQRDFVIGRQLPRREH